MRKRSMAPGEAIFGRSQVAVGIRKELVDGHVKAGTPKAEADRRAVIHLFQELVIEIVRIKKIPLERLADAVRDTIVLEAMEA